MPFAADTFSLVFNSSTIEHLDDPAHAVREMQRICRQEGRVFVGVPYRYGPLAFQPLIYSTVIGRWLGPVFSRRGLTELLTTSGLAPVASVRYFWNFFVGAVAVKLSKADCPALGESQP
jgi:SAM-dependent methyltransferase